VRERIPLNQRIKARVHPLELSFIGSNDKMDRSPVSTPGCREAIAVLAEFLHDLLFAGKVVVRDRPSSSARHRSEAIGLLGRAFADYRLSVAGPLIDFDATTALAAAELVRQACWFLVNHDEPDEELEKRLTMPAPPTLPAQHLSADLTLRYLPQIHRRARALAAADRLPELLASILRQWPLTGVLADVPEQPTTALDFAGHPGLLLLYAERLAQNDRSAWQPEGRGTEYVELVRADTVKGATHERNR
jgi:MoxR-vWA-beta-propeller ternary system domain bpX4